MPQQLQHAYFGSMTWDDSCLWYAGEVQFPGGNLAVFVEADEGNPAPALESAQQNCQRVEALERNIRICVAARIAGDVWDEDSEEDDEDCDVLAERLEMKSLTFASDGI